MMIEGDKRETETDAPGAGQGALTHVPHTFWWI